MSCDSDGHLPDDDENGIDNEVSQLYRVSAFWACTYTRQTGNKIEVDFLA